jgi:N-acetylmuramoyl-L-alanine amidase/Fe-S cluster assembly iron-binding protein IscA
MLKRNRIILSALIFVTPVWAQFSGIKIMVNPGHGGHDSDDRFIAKTGFWESEGNLTKGLYLRDLLEARGAEVIISRTQNRSEDDLPLSQISAIANSNDVDYFQSIHSNGFQGTANRTSVFWEEKSNGQPDFPDAKRMAEILDDKLFEVNFTTKTANHGDLSYLGFNLGVLRSLQMPGTLTEGSFHDYIPESYRLINLDYRKHESVAILRAMLQYFNLPSLSYGAIAGLVKDKSKTVSYVYTGGKSNDRYKPLNNLFARLYQGQNFVADYHGDFNNNGYFVFDSLSAGAYTLVVDYGAYKTDTLQINVNANKTTFKEIFAAADNQKAPLVYSTFPTDNFFGLATYSSLEITFSQPMDANTTEAAFSIVPTLDGNFEWKQGNQLLVFNPSEAFTPQTEYMVSINTQAQNSTGKNIEETFSFNFTTAATHDYPLVSKTSPAQNDSITIFDKFDIYFNQEMIREEVEQAFTIDPPVTGAFSWANDQHFTFTPDSLSINTFYTITISTGARNTFSVGLENNFQLHFKTYNRSDLNILDWYPKEGDAFISTLTSFYFRFDGTLNVSTVIANLALQDESGNDISRDSYKLEERNGASVLRFDAEQPLKRGAKYTVTVFPGIKDVDDLTFKDTLRVSFMTDTLKYVSGSVIDDFEADTKWQNPDEGPATINLDLDNSNFAISVLEKINGQKSAKINYIFTDDSLGICQVLREEPFSLSFADSSFFGLWVYGDYSFNTLELWYDSNDLQNKSIYVDTLDYSGWKFVKIPTNLFDDNSILLHSIVLRQQPGAYPSGQIFIDDIQQDVITALDEHNNNLLITDFALLQNYPNPFNPKTTIVYSLKESATVTLTVYNQLGQTVKVLVSKKQLAGSHKVVWDASNLASGIYYYRLQAGKGFVKTKKLVLLK